ncbi:MULTISPECIES: hypothetical protein [Roseobacteraceae]|uniref:hypothetical protein n=1 Tax=Roseobacteraceae TaxID=2854170 RepID=UPI002B26F970|nr:MULTISPECIES: hypothetical protein [Roseobacteraceae]
MIRPLVLAALCLPTAAAAACFGDAGTPLFHCTVDGGETEIRVCLQDNAAYYAYGAPGRAPDIVFSRHVQDIHLTPWPGIGRTYWEEVAFANGPFEYRINHSFDRNGELPASGLLTVTRDGLQIAELRCQTGGASVADFQPLFDAKEESGQCYDLGSRVWGSCS